MFARLSDTKCRAHRAPPTTPLKRPHMSFPTSGSFAVPTLERRDRSRAFAWIHWPWSCAHVPPLVGLSECFESGNMTTMRVLLGSTDLLTIRSVGGTKASLGYHVSHVYDSSSWSLGHSRQVPRLLIDWSADPAEPSLPVLGRPWRRVRGDLTHNHSVVRPLFRVVWVYLCVISPKEQQCLMIVLIVSVSACPPFAFSDVCMLYVTTSMVVGCRHVLHFVKLLYFQLRFTNSGSGLSQLFTFLTSFTWSHGRRVDGEAINSKGLSVPLLDRPDVDVRGAALKHLSDDVTR